MIKHIVGFIIFTFIIGTSALIAALFNPVQQNVRSVRVSRDYPVYTSRKRCRKRKKRKRRPRTQREYRNLKVSTGITQAVFNPKKNELTTSHDFGNETRRFEREMVFHFYVKDGNNVRHVMSRPLPSHPVTKNSINWFDGLNGIVRDGNLYIMQTYGEVKGDWNNAPEFDEAKATPVLIRNNY